MDNYLVRVWWIEPLERTIHSAIWTFETFDEAASQGHFLMQHVGGWDGSNIEHDGKKWLWDFKLETYLPVEVHDETFNNN